MKHLISLRHILNNSFGKSVLLKPLHNIYQLSSACLPKSYASRILIPTYPYCKLIPTYRNYSTLPICIWPANLPPATEWGYGSLGPDTWPNKYPHAGGENQSPIDIVTSLVQPKEFEAPVTWTYPKSVCQSIVNTGCGWRVDAHGEESELTGGPLSHSYELAQFHCHWSDTPCCGSEHTVDGKCYAGELHFVHWNKELFGCCADAVPSPAGLTVIAVFLEEGEENSEIQKLCDVLAEIPVKDQRVELSSDIDIPAMYPGDHEYWTYMGSLTTPPCYESVTWIVFKNPITVSQEQLNCFRQMKKPCDHEEDENTGFIEKNYRPPQSLNDREIFECV